MLTDLNPLQAMTSKQLSALHSFSRQRPQVKDWQPPITSLLGCEFSSKAVFLSRTRWAFCPHQAWAVTR